jgi:hypothetical protein
VSAHSGPDVGPSGRGARRQVPFVLHELAEYIVAAALVAVGLHLSGGAQLVLVSVGVVMILLGAFTSGKLGAFALLSRRAHHAGDLILATVLALSPALVYRELHIVGTVLAEVVALVLLRIERGTLYRDVPRARRASPLASATASGDDPVVRLAATAGAVASSAATAASQLAPTAGRAARIGLRSLGIVAGATKRAAREHAAGRRRAGDS